MAWSDLCGKGVVVGKKIALNTLWGAGVQHDKRGKTELPAALTLGKMADKAQGLKVKESKGKGIGFSVVHCTIGNDGTTLNCTEKFNKFVNQKSGAAVCYEDTFLPIEIPAGHILVRQTVAPCTRCRSGYRAWAQDRRCTIIVSADEEYDQSGKNPVFVFTPTG